jgi:hypothetical protein
MAALTTSVSDTSQVQRLPEKDRTALARAVAPTLPAEVKEEVFGGGPNPWATDFIWIMLVTAVALVLIGAAGAMIWVFIQTGRLDPGAMLTVFTTVMGFVAGLLIKSPTTG